MAWVFLACAGLLEVFWSSFLKLSDGFTKLGWSVMTIAGMLASFYLLSQAMKTLPLGTAYAVWTGIWGRRLRGGGHPDLQGAGDRRPDVFHRVAADGHCRHQADLFPLRENRKRGPVRSSFFHRCRYRSTTVTSWPVWGRKTCSRSSVRRRRLASFLQGWQPNQAASWTARSITSRTRRSVS